MSEWTPSTFDVQSRYDRYRIERDSETATPYRPGEFQRWYASEVRAAKAEVVDEIRNHMRVIRGAQFDILNGRPEMDSEDEISASLRGIEEVLDRADQIDTHGWEGDES